jgi:peptidoglycan/LPS O-acetylase OafA/YrhL
MVPTTRERTDELQALEELWAAPALGEKPVRRALLPRVPGALLAGSWLAFYAVVLAFQPEPEHGMTTPVWATTVSTVMLLMLLGAVAIGPVVSKVGFGLAALAGPLGIVLAVNCRASGHHLGNWWLAELGATVALTGLATAGLAQRLRTRG